MSENKKKLQEIKEQTNLWKDNVISSYEGMKNIIGIAEDKPLNNPNDNENIEGE